MLITIDKSNARPLYLQLILQIKEQIRKGSLRPGEELPSVRELADNLGINMLTVRSAYVKLREQGVINLALGRRATVASIKSPDNKRLVEAEISGRLEEIVTDALLMGLTVQDVQKLLKNSIASLETGNER
ncbi:MAG TPA: GntR family transcriptional regulator [Dehalococcoidales bacterium]|nr:GntR family transcriptional regulator [Dehalococcoidales bacterium]